MLHDLVARVMSVAAAQGKLASMGAPKDGSVRAFVSRNGWFFLHPDGRIVTDGSVTDVDTPHAAYSPHDDEFEGDVLDERGIRNETTATTAVDVATPWELSNPAVASTSLSQGHLLLRMLAPTPTLEPCFCMQQFDDKSFKVRAQISGALSPHVLSAWGMAVRGATGRHVMFTYACTGDAYAVLVLRLNGANAMGFANRGSDVTIARRQAETPHYVELEWHADGPAPSVVFRTSQCGLDGTFETVWQERASLWLGNSVTHAGYGILSATLSDSPPPPTFVLALASNWFREVLDYAPSLIPYAKEDFSEFVVTKVLETDKTNVTWDLLLTGNDIELIEVLVVSAYEVAQSAQQVLRKVAPINASHVFTASLDSMVDIQLVMTNGAVREARGVVLNA
jgi:hypothetical protein